MPISNACVYIHIYLIFVFIHMKPERYIDGSSEILSHILVLSLVDDPPFPIDQFHSVQRHSYP